MLFLLARGGVTTTVLLTLHPPTPTPQTTPIVFSAATGVRLTSSRRQAIVRGTSVLGGVA